MKSIYTFSEKKCPTESKLSTLKIKIYIAVKRIRLTKNLFSIISQKQYIQKN